MRLQRAGVFVDAVRLFPVDAGDLPQDRNEAGPAEARLLRKVGSAPERLALGGEEHRQRPAALLAERVKRAHIDLVHIGPFFPVDLDIDEERVHDLRDLRIFEALMGHHVAPMTGRVADGDQHRPIEALGLCKRLFAPFPPVDRVVAVLEQVGRACLLEAVHDAASGWMSASCEAERGAATGLKLRRPAGSAPVWILKVQDMRSDDTIFAPASGFGRAAVCVIRISGPQSRFMVETIAGALPPPRRLALRMLRDPASGEPLDQALVAWMPGPASFTGEDQAELHIHGGLASRAADLALPRRPPGLPVGRGRRIHPPGLSQWTHGPQPGRGSRGSHRRRDRGATTPGVSANSKAAWEMPPSNGARMCCRHSPGWKRASTSLTRAMFRRHWRPISFVASKLWPGPSAGPSPIAAASGCARV